jgi:hypothetical protein
MLLKDGLIKVFIAKIMTQKEQERFTKMLIEDNVCLPYQN